MRLIDVCDMGDAPERGSRRRFGDVKMISQHIVRVTYVTRVPGRSDHVAVVHLLWDVADFRRSLAFTPQLSTALDQTGRTVPAMVVHGAH